MREVQSNGSRIDVWIGNFIERYRYQILALLALLSIIGGVVLAEYFYSKKPEEIVFISANENWQEQGIASFKVSVQGEVVSPGTYEFTSEVTIGEVIVSAGGQTAKADIARLNLEEKVTSDREIVVPMLEPAVSSDGGQSMGVSDSGLVGLNSASLSELMSLPGIGEVYANRIIAARPFSNVNELLKVSGIGPKRFAKIKDLVSIE